MTGRIRHWTAKVRSPRPSITAATPLVIGIALFSLTGCGAGLVGHGAASVDQRPEPKLSKLDRSVLEIREQSRIDPTQPYWPYRLGQIYLAADSTAQAE